MRCGKGEKTPPPEHIGEKKEIKNPDNAHEEKTVLPANKVRKVLFVCRHRKKGKGK